MVFASIDEATVQSYNSAFRIGAKTPNYMQVNFTLPEFTISDEVMGALNYSRVNIPGAATLMEPGMPELPTVSTSIAIPARGQVSIEVISSQQRVIGNFLPYPVQQGNDLESPKSFVINNDFYSGLGTYPEAAIKYGDPTILRDFRIITVQMNPFSYNAETGELIIHDNIEFRLNYNSETGINELLTEPTAISSSFDSLYESMILNYADYRSAVFARTPPRYLIIYGTNTDPTYLTAVNEYALWKRQKGADVDMASTSSAEAGSSTTTIKAYIQARYNNLATRPDYVILIGDTSGSYTIPAFTVSSGGGDYPYTHLAGTDILGDCFIGRISVENLFTAYRCP